MEMEKSVVAGVVLARDELPMGRLWRDSSVVQNRTIYDSARY